ncbi:MAG: type II toxin-antitoxin system HipA family toxin [Pseudomonadota bacterium]|nr:type II toxin-antitoxin system HipA family toxin [Pseudomonadota bacterium]
MVTEVIRVTYQGQEAGAVSFDTERGTGAFEYTPAFIDSGIELSPLMMPLARRVYSFPQLDFATFHGLPGLIADSLPDDFGNAVLNAWVAARGMQPQHITPLQRLQYTGRRGMGALEYLPATRLKSLNASQQVDVEALVMIAQEVLDQRNQFSVDLDGHGAEDREAMMALLSVGMSAGGARPKAVLAFNDDFTEVRSGQTSVPDGFSHYLMKFDGVTEHQRSQQTFGDPVGYGAMEYVYYRMATACGIEMMPCYLLAEGSRRHFITRRYDRGSPGNSNEKIHVQTLNGLAHVDYKRPGSFSYAELFAVARQLKLSAAEAEQLLRRMLFNIVARNHDDHAKNVSFMLRGRQWSLAPAYDVAYSYKPGSQWVSQHWMSLNGKRDHFTRDDLYSLEKISPLFSRRKINRLLEEITEQVSRWPQLAREYEVPPSLLQDVSSNLRLSW